MTVGDVRQMSSICGLGAFYGLIASMAGNAAGKSGSLVMNESELVSKAVFPWDHHIPLITNVIQTLHPLHIILCDNNFGLIQDIKRVLLSHKMQHV